MIFRQSLLPSGAHLALTPEETRHIRARRLRPGETIYVGDGIRNRREAVLVDERSVQLGDLETTGIEPDRTLVTAIPEKVRWDWLLEKAVELGVTRILPAEFRHSDRTRVNQERGDRTILAAAAQSRRFRLPVIQEPRLFLDILADLDPESTIAFHPGGEPATPGGFSGMIIGPEGGLSPEEVGALQADGFRIASFGARILRVETAALAALCLSFSA